jgi:branched-chain amino acid transport system ATP-binding protein
MTTRRDFMLLEIRDVFVRYGKAIALNGITLEANDGEVVALIGSNGAGKTTTLRAISGLNVPNRGEILFQGKSISGVSPHQIVRMGIAHVPEGRRVFPAMTVEENLELGAYLRTDRHVVRQDFERMYESFPVLKQRRRQKAGSLSGGEQQMLAMARALMTSPKLLLLDEPSLGLAPLLVREVGMIIARINSQGVTIILIEQNARMALKLAHRAYILELGKIILQGNARDLVKDESVKMAYLGTGTRPG